MHVIILSLYHNFSIILAVFVHIYTHYYLYIITCILRYYIVVGVYINFNSFKDFNYLQWLIIGDLYVYGILWIMRRKFISSDLYTLFG